jgi:eukaryotic-like serine/threonine-protein kinase
MQSNTTPFDAMPPTPLAKGPLPHFLQVGSAGALAGLFADEVESAQLGAGSVFDHYLLLEKIADGGFGSVWRAEQQEPVVREVALKLIRSDRCSPEVMSRFERERQALAMMDHEHIARVYEGGSFEGQLFFAMEYVAGVPITTYAQQKGLSLHLRIELFIPVCQAVHHAHTKLILHRDLKPANILVVEKEGRPVVKVIDFGIAKALAPDHAVLRADSSALPATQVGYVLGTPQYMSPEQARGSADIDASSDTYTLGIILYELLVGEPPVTQRDLDGLQSHFAMLEHIIKHEPSLPSTLWLQASDRQLRQWDATLGSPRRVSRQLRGDLDWIILHALEKERRRRYDSADKLADDLQRHLLHEPVSVGPPSLSYRLGKLYLRHRVATLAAAAVVLSILGFGTVAWMQRNAAIAERSKAESAAANESVARAEAVRAQGRAEQAQREAEASALLATERKAEAESATVAERKARAVADKAHAEAEGLISFLLYEMRDALEPMGRTDLLGKIAKEGAAYYEEMARDDPRTLYTHNGIAMFQNKGMVELSTGDTDAALASFARSLELAQTVAKREPRGLAQPQIDLALAHNRIGTALQQRGQLGEARQAYEEEFAIVSALAATHPNQPQWRSHLASVHEHLGDIGKDPLLNYEEALRLLMALHLESPKSMLVSTALASVHGRLGRLLSAKQPNEALRHFAAQLALLDGLGADVMRDIRLRRARLLCVLQTAECHSQLGKLDLALALFEPALVQGEAMVAAYPGHRECVATLIAIRHRLADCHAKLGDACLTPTSVATLQRRQMSQALTHYKTARQLLATSTENPELQHGSQALLTVLDEKIANLEASR